MKHFNHISELEVEREQRSKLYLEFLRVSSMSAGLYVLSPGSADPQKPHKEDELYYVVRGQGRMRVGREERDVNAGSVIFVQANEEHRFLDIREELVVLVIFAPAET